MRNAGSPLKPRGTRRFIFAHEPDLFYSSLGTVNVLRFHRRLRLSGSSGPLFGLVVFFLFSLVGPVSAAATEIRVRILHAAAAEFTGDLRYRGRDTRGADSPVTIRVGRGGLMVNGERERGAVELRARRGMVSVAGRSYRGNMRITAVEGRVQVINRVPLNEYLASVLGSEMGPSWPPEALKAQAVVARSYVMARRQASKSRDFDVEASVLSQVYRGIEGEDPRTQAAVRATRNRVLTHEGRVIEAFYHSTCGGRTEDPGAIWTSGASPIRSVEDTYCDISPHFFWTHRISPRELGRLLGLPPIQAVKILSRSPGGRAMRVQFVSGDDRSRTLDGDEVRKLLGYNRLRSTLFRVTADDGVFLFRGGGSGHGVGLCQWGARAQAEEGRDYRTILRHYYPELRLSRL